MPVRRRQSSFIFACGWDLIPTQIKIHIPGGTFLISLFSYLCFILFLFWKVAHIENNSVNTKVDKKTQQTQNNNFMIVKLLVRCSMSLENVKIRNSNFIGFLFRANCICFGNPIYYSSPCMHHSSKLWQYRNELCWLKVQ